MAMNGHFVRHGLFGIALCSIALCTLLVAAGCGKKIAPPTETNQVLQSNRVDFQSKLEQIKPGMAYEDVVKVLGGVQGTEVPAAGAGGTANAPETPNAPVQKTYQWADANGNLLSCSFVSNKLSWKDVVNMSSSGGGK